MVLTTTEATALRYLYTCVWKSNVGALNDEFFSSFLVKANSLFV